MLKITNLSGRRWYFVAAICLILAMQSAISAQESSGKVIGNVTDPKGAVIPDAKLTVTNVETQVSREATTNGEGNFEVLSLPIGNYRVMAERAGFKKTVSEVEKLQINQSLRFDIKMEVGTQSETVTVTSQASGVETVSPTLGQSVTSRPLVNLPLNGRNVLQLALLQPGVTENRSTGQAGLFSISGGKSDSVTYLLDGGLNNNLLSNDVVYNPNPDAVAEFRI